MKWFLNVFSVVSCFALLISPLFAVTLTLDPSSITLGGTARIIISAKGQVNDAIDLTPLKQDFTLLGTQQMTQYTMVNGKSSSVTTWIIVLMPKHAGSLAIPSLQIGQHSTQPTQLVVKATRPGSATVDTLVKQDVFLKNEASTLSPFVNEQVIYTVKLYTASSLFDPAYDLPAIQDGLLVPIGQSTRYEETINDTHYLVEEQKYAVFAQKSGPIAINPPRFTALTNINAPQSVTVSGKKIVLNVKPIPSDKMGDQWVASKGFNIKEQYKPQLSTPLHEGDLLVRTITLKGVGVPAQLLPTITINPTKDYRVYSEKPIEKNQVIDSDVVGERTITLTYAFIRSGSIELPEIKIPWFNTVTQKEEILILKPQTVTVIPTLQPKPEDMPVLTQKDHAVKTSAYGYSGWFVAFGIALAWLLSVTYRYWSRWFLSCLLYVRRGNELSTLEKACLNNSPVLAEKALIRWGRKQFSDDNIKTGMDLRRHIPDDDFATAVAALSTACYSKEPIAWQGDGLLAAIKKYSNHKKKKKNLHDPLPPIF